jgi:toxin-antitoxin system PIN domain toxin
MILPDINLLVFALDRNSPHHAPSAEWWNTCLAASTPVCLPWVVILGVVRILGNPKIFRSPTPPESVLDQIENWLNLPHVHLLDPSPAHLTTLRNLLKVTGAGGGLTGDAHLAAIAIDKGITLYSNDTDFSRFPGLSWANPLAI